MKKIPTLFERIYENHKVVGVTDKVTEGCEWVLEGKGTPTIKWDGSCTAIINGEYYKRYDAKKGKKPPLGAIPCQDAPDPVTGHFPHWVKVDPNNPADKWYVEAYNNHIKYEGMQYIDCDGTFEAVGKHFQGNPYGYEYDTLVAHGSEITVVEPTFEGIKRWLEENYEEGIVWWLDGEPRCKIKRTDFGLKWGNK